MHYNEGLIIDAGMHLGKDTEFYLKKGFHVIGIEANPALVDSVNKRLASYIENGRLRIYNVAICKKDGWADFFVNDDKHDWGTASARRAKQNEKLGTKNRKIKIPCMKFEDILNDCGIPYYLKIDIEGSDTLCLQSLRSFSCRPKYLSVETSISSHAEAHYEISLLKRLGYRQLKITNQVLNHKIKCPDPPLEGNFVNQKFDEYCSGTFGEESPGKWLSVEETHVRYREILKKQELFGARWGESSGKYYNTLRHKLSDAFRKVTRLDPIGWYDIHGKFCG